MMKFGYQLGKFLYRRAWLGRLLENGGERVKKDLALLNPGKDVQMLWEDYCCKKLARSFVIGIIGLSLAMAVKVKNGSDSVIENGYISRNNYNEEGQEWELIAVLESGEQKELSVLVEPRELTADEYDALAEEFAEQLPSLILQDNPTLQEVTKDLLLAESYADYPFWVKWQSTNPDVVTSTGKVCAVEEDTEVVLYADVSYGEEKWLEEYKLCVKPEFLSEEERLNRELEELMVTSESMSRTNAEWKLPEHFAGGDIIWKREIEDGSYLLGLGGVAVAALIFVLADKDLHDEVLQKRRQMKCRYPDLVRKLTLYLGAGLTIRTAFQKLAPEYEEINYICRELQAGISEIQAYEHFGKRTGVQEYIRLSTLLTQNLKKGNADLLIRLREEVAGIEVEKVQNCRRLAEEATTKLLVPMVLFLSVVMIMIMVPAFSSMGG